MHGYPSTRLCLISDSNPVHKTAQRIFLSRQRYDESNPSASHDLANHIYSLETQKKYTYS